MEFVGREDEIRELRRIRELSRNTAPCIVACRRKSYVDEGHGRKHDTHGVAIPGRG